MMYPLKETYKRSLLIIYIKDPYDVVVYIVAPYAQTSFFPETLESSKSTV